MKTGIDAGDGSSLEPEIESAFRQAFAARDAVALRALVQRHPSARAWIDAPLFPFDSPALVHFAGAGNRAMVEALLDLGADPNRRSDWWAGGFHPLHVVTGEVAERLIEAGAVPDACAAANLDRPDLLRRLLEDRPDLVHERGGDGQTPLHFARSRAVVDLLLESGADIDARDVDHRATPAQWMLDPRRGEGRYGLAEYLVERGASTDIFMAAALGLAGRITSMLEADPQLLALRTGQGAYGEQPPSSYHIYTWTIGTNLSPLQVAAQFSQEDALEALRSAASPRDLFLAACASGDGEEARRRLHERPDLMGMLEPGDHRILADAAWAPDPAAVALMMALGFDPASPGHDSGTALHCAAWEGSAASMEAILQHARGRALIEARDAHHGGTPLDWCCHGAHHCGRPGADHPRVARLLLEAGARPGPDYGDAPERVRAVIASWRGDEA